MPEDNAITNEILLEHMQAMGNSIRSEMKAMGAGIRSEMQAMEKRLTKDITELKTDVTELKTDVKSINAALQRLYHKRTELTEQVRIIEEEELPPIKRKLSIA